MAIDTSIFKISLLVLMVIFGITKKNLTNKHLIEDGVKDINLPMNIILLLVIASIGIVLFPLVWIFSDLLSFAEFRLSSPIRVFGLGLYLSMILLMYWQMITLDVNISMVRDDRYLVTDGPYRYIRHPLYTIFIIITFSMTLIAANWAFAIYSPIVFFIMLFRVQYEEHFLKNEFGQSYVDYMKETKKFFPKLF